MIDRLLRRLETQPVWFWLLALLVLGAGIGLRDAWPPDEPRFALIARDMLMSGDWLIPRVAGVVYPDKPPFFMWAIASMTWLTGSLRIGFLLPSLLAGLGTLWLVKDLGTRLWDARTGLIAAVALLVTLQFTTQARFAQIDMLLCVFVTLGVYGLSRHLLRGPDWIAYGIACAAMGLGVITKAVGFLPLALLPVYAWAAWRAWPGASLRWDARWLLGPLLMLVAIALWLVPMFTITQGGAGELASYRHDILFTQTVTRYVSAWHHVKPVWYYLLQVIPGLWLPVIAALPWLVPAWRRALAARDLRILLLLGYAAAVVIFFSISPGKRGVYVFPALPAFVLAASPYLADICGRIAARRTAMVALVLAVLLPTIVVGLALAGRFTSLTESDLDQVAGPAWVLLGSIFVSAIAWIWLGGSARACVALCGWIMSTWVLYGLLLMPALDRIRSGALIMEAARAALMPGQQLGMISFVEQQVLQAERPLVHFGYRRNDLDQQALDAAAWLMVSDANRLLVQAGAMAGCWDPTTAVDLVHAHRRDWFLVGARDTTPACREAAGQVADWRERMVRYDSSDRSSTNSISR